jgi:hypothetical protein
MSERFRGMPVGASASLVGVKPATDGEMANTYEVPMDAPTPGGLTHPGQIPTDFDARTAVRALSGRLSALSVSHM